MDEALADAVIANGHEDGHAAQLAEVQAHPA